jgi:hypothetical protein
MLQIKFWRAKHFNATIINVIEVLPSGTLLISKNIHY